MTKGLQGDLNGENLRIGIVVSRFNEFVTAKLLDGAVSSLTQHGVRDDDVTIAWVPGAFEIPLVTEKMARSGRYDAIVCVGAVIKGETDHYTFVAQEAAKGIASTSRSTGVPVVFNVLTTNTVQQAIDRAGGKHGNTGHKAGVAAIEMANLLRTLEAE